MTSHELPIYLYQLNGEGYIIYDIFLSYSCK